MRHDPHKLVEGCLIAGTAMRARAAYIYIRQASLEYHSPFDMQDARACLLATMLYVSVCCSRRSDMQCCLLLSTQKGSQHQLKL